ncbi:MAG: UDPGP type 1 family protein [Phycisphaerales bacterium]|nr:UDPGP type 1 family protein [Phycisphaerales bacterium]
MTTATLDSVRDRLAAVEQDHLLRFHDELDPAAAASLIEQINSIELDSLPRLIDTYVHGDEHFEIPTDIEPAPYYPRDPTSPAHPWDRDAAVELGEQLIAQGKVGCFTVAGGQGSRLGYEGPKGCYPTGVISNKPLFQIFAEGILAASRKHQRPIPWYIMTSPLNHEATEAFFREHDHFGLCAEDVMFFMQGTLPSFDKQAGKVLLAGKSTIATSPDGHGGAIKALHASGATADMAKRGVEHISYWQVDNPNIHVLDPVFIGLHAGAEDSSAEMSSKMLPKAEAKEKVGVFCRSAGRTMVVEYSDLPDALAEQTNPDGSLRFIAGSPAIHMLGVAFVDKVASDPAFALPYHRAVKKVPYVDLETGHPVEPSEPNAVKLERFVFDAIPMAGSSIVLETDRVEEFAPVKNKDGVDSIITSKRLQTERAARWLETAGVTVPRNSDGTPDCVIEIGPLTATSAGALAGRDDLPGAIRAGSNVVL